MPQSYSAADIINFARSQGYLDDHGQVKNDAAGKSLWDDAQRYGVSLNQLDNAFGWNSGTAQKWLSDRGLYTPPATTQTAQPSTTQGQVNGNTTGNQIDTGAQTGTTTGSTSTASATNTAAPTPGQGTIAQTQQPGDFSSMIASIVAGIRGTAPAAPAAPVQPAAFKPTQEMLDGMDAGKRITGLLSGETAQQASRQALQLANSRGLLNSSMAVEGANEAMIRNAAEIANGDANRFLSLVQAGMSRDTALDSLFARAGFDERNLQLKNQNDLTSGVLDFAMRDAANVRDSNAEYARGLQKFVLETSRDREDTATTRAYNDRVRSEGLAREDANADTALQGVYSSQVIGLRDEFNAEIAAVEGSDLPPEQKAARNAEIRARYTTLLDLTNSIFSAMPKWKSEWSQLELTETT